MADTENPFARWEFNFREQMKLKRVGLGLTQTDLAKRLKNNGLAFHQQTVQRIENGDRPVRLDEAFLIARNLGFPIESMVRPVSAQAGAVTQAVDSLKRRGGQLDDELSEIFGTWLEEFDLLAVAFLDVWDSAGHKPTPLVLWSAAWVIKALWVHDWFTELAAYNFGIVGSGIYHDTEEWLSQFHPGSELAEAVRWVMDEGDWLAEVPEDERPLVLADMNSDDLYQHLKVDDDGEHQEAP